MKNRFFLFSLFYISSVFQILAQEKINIEYEVIPYFESIEKNNFDIIVTSSLFLLTTEKNESLYKFVPKINNTQNEVSNDISATMSADTNSVYKNTETKTYIEEARIGEKQFLIKDDLPQIEWIITKEAKDVAGFPAFKATAMLNDEYKTKIDAWYSNKLSYKTGPDKFWGLPGIILEVQTEINYEDGSKEGTKYLATKIEVLKSAEKIKPLDKGKEITSDNFDKLQKDYLQTQMEMYGGGVDKD